jgi:hypothetical protein
MNRASPSALLSSANGIDVFGDIHGQSEALHAGRKAPGYDHSQVFGEG